MNTYTRRQGDALWIDITADNVELIDETWTNWTGKWNITLTTDIVVILSGTLTRSATTGIFYLRIGPVSGGATWLALPVGEYLINYQIDSVSADFRYEDSDKLFISVQKVIDA